MHSLNFVHETIFVIPRNAETVDREACTFSQQPGKANGVAAHLFGCVSRKESA